MSECPNQELLQQIYALIADKDSDEVIPMLMSIAAGAAAQSGVNRTFFTNYALETIEDAYKLFTRDESEAVH